MEVNVLGIPWIGDPCVFNLLAHNVAAGVHDAGWKVCLFGLFLVVENKHQELGGGGQAQLPFHLGDVLLELGDRIVERGSGVIDLVDDDHVFADKRVQVVAQVAEIKPLGPDDLLADGVRLGVAHVLVERQADGLDGDVALPVSEKGPEDSGGDEAAASDGNDKVDASAAGFDFLGRFLAKLVHDVVGDVKFF